MLSDGTTPTDFRAGDAALFDDNATGTTIADLDSTDIAPSSVTFNKSTKTYTIQSTGGLAITGSTYIIKNGTGTVFINNSNSFTGGITINGGMIVLNAANTFTGDIQINAGGVLQLGAASAVGTGNAVVFGPNATSGTKLQLNGNSATVTGLDTSALFPGTPVVENSHATNNSVLTINTASTSVFAGTLQNGGAGTLAITLTGGGTLILTGTNTLTGGNTVSSGTLQIGQGGTAGTLSGNTSVASGSSLVFNRSDSSSYAGNISGAGSFAKQGAGTLGLYR